MSAEWTHEHGAFDGEIICLVVWSVALSLKEMRAIYLGVDPRTIRLDKIIEMP